MEDQAKYHVKESAECPPEQIIRAGSPLDPKRHYREYRQQQDHERPFHGDYLQGKKTQQYETTAICLGYVLALIIGLALIFGVFFVGRWAIQFITAL